MKTYAEKTKENTSHAVAHALTGRTRPVMRQAAPIARPAVPRAAPVVQREILIGSTWKKPYDDTLVTAQRDLVKPYITQWPKMETIFDKGTVGKTRDAKEAYLNNDTGLESHVRAMLRKYNDKKSFAGDQELARQLVQDVKLLLLGLESIAGIDQQDGQFSKKADSADAGRTGKGKTLRIYRTMKAEHWNTYLASGDPKDILWGHGGSLGQALHYFLKSKADNLDDVLVEFEFPGKAGNLIDYTQIKRGGEGTGPKDGKLTGKNEDNDVMALDEEIFSINLGKSKELISELNPKITLKDKVRR